MKLIPYNVETCLDIGCGKGELSDMLSKKSKNVIAVDLADKIFRIMILYMLLMKQWEGDYFEKNYNY